MAEEQRCEASPEASHRYFCGVTLWRRRASEEGVASAIDCPAVSTREKKAGLVMQIVCAKLLFLHYFPRMNEFSLAEVSFDRNMTL
jgi:hypothetical protein